MDESDAFVHVSEKEKIKALKLVVDADGYLAQRQLLQALNLYKESAEILPDPATIRKIKKLRKYMKRHDMDLGEDKENQVDYINSGKQVSPGAITTPNNGKSLRERVNFAVSSGNYPKDSPKSSVIISDHVTNIKPENASIKKQEYLDVIVTGNKLLETASDCLPAAVPENGDDKIETQHKRDIRHQKPRLSSLDLKPEVPLDNAKNSLSKLAPPATLDTPRSEKISPNSEDRIRSFKDLRRRMYPHQKEGMKWLARLFGEQKGGILGDDMGLGKTLQVIGYLYKMFEVNEIEHVLIVLPSALILPWQSEITRWAPNLNYATFHGKTRAGRMKLLHNLQREGGILLTTYGLIVTNYEELSKGPDGRQFIWDYVFLDEGHKIKNPTKTQKAAHYIPAHNRIIITGTPIQNNLVEMWSLFDFVHHGSLLGTIKTFKISYENTITRARQKDASLEEKQLGYTMSLNLQKIIAPYFLRRTKAELMADPDSGLPKLPRKNDIIVWLKMTADQKKVYESYLRLDEVKELMSSSRSPLVALNILKKICDHLRLLSVRICKALGMLTTEETRKYAEDRISHLDEQLEIPEWTRQPGAEEPATSIPAKQSKETDCAATQLTGIPDTLLYKESSKLMIVIELLGYLSATGHKCLVFSQSSKMLDIIQQILINLHYRHVRMDGQITKLDQRAEIIRRFETNKDIHIFLLTTQVGGVGLNLTVADRIIIVDPSWNPAIDSQAVDRIYRIGQKKNVIIFRLITCGTVEEKIYIRQLFKLSINKQTTKESKDPFRYFTKQDLKQLFIVDDLSVSETQLQLAQMHANKRVSDEVVDDQIKFLESMESVFGVSDHDLVFSTEDADQEVKMSNSRLQTMVENAEKAIRNEINEESRANAKKMVPGIQERRPPSVETWTDEPARLSSPLLNLYDEEENEDESSRQREVRHRKSNAGPNSVFPTSEEVVVVSDQETSSSCLNNNDNDVIILSDVQSDVNDDNCEVILDSEDEHPPHVGHGTFSALGKHSDGKAAGDCEANKTTTQDIDTSSNSDTAEPPRPHQQSLANKTLMRVIADSPLSPRKAGLKNVLVADSPDTFMKSISSGSQCSSDSLSPSNSAKLTVAESDYESDESLKEDAVVMESQDEAEDRGSRKGNGSKVGEDDSQEFYSPVFRDVSVVVPNSSPSAGSLLVDSQTVTPASASQFPNSHKTDSVHAAPEMQSLTEQLHMNLSLDDSVIIRSVKQNAHKRRVLSSSDGEGEVSEPHSLSSSGKKANLSSETGKDSGNGSSSRKHIGSSSASCKGRRRPQLIMSDSSSEEDDQAASASISYSESLSERLQRRKAGKAKRFVLSSSDDDDDEVNDGSSKTADNSLVVTEELSFCVNPSEPLIQCIKTPPAKMSHSRLSNLEKSLSSPSHSDSCSPSAKSLAEKESGPTLKSGVDECDMDSDDSKDGGSSFNDDDDEEEEEDSAAEEEEEEDSAAEEEDSAAEEEEEDSAAEEDEEEDSAGDEEEDSTEDEEDSEDDSNNIELPKPSPQKTDLYNQHINASREAYHTEDYVEALKQALQALHQDSSDIKLQMYALWLRKMSKK